MPTYLTTTAEEESTYLISAAFTDENDVAVVPDTITWTLTDADGNVINSREDVSVSSPAASVDIVLSGDDLGLQAGETGDVVRILTIEATYDSDAGDDLPLKDKATFIIKNLEAVV
jgi:hypothetical protein